MRLVAMLCAVLLLAGCNMYTVGAVGVASAFVATEAIDDRSPIDYAAEFFGRQCQNYSLYDQPPRCRSSR